ncbi:MAG: sporulation integral membrane protein YtvI [Clostridiales bacterium]|nr:sporulation integral membrane protein YtvI [Clostridiales bacterium]
MKLKQNWLRIILLILGIAALVACVWLFLPKILAVAGYIAQLFMPFIIAYLFAKLVDPLADWLQRKLKIPRGLSAVLVIIFIVGILGGAITMAVWKIVDELRSLYDQFPAIYANAKETAGILAQKWAAVYNNLPANMQDSLSNIGEQISDAATSFINRKSTPMVDYASRFAKALPKVFVAVIVFILSTYFMIQDSSLISNAAKRIVPERFYRRLDILKQELMKYLGGYLKAQGILMLIAFFMLFLELSIVGVEYAMLIALLIAFIDALPFFGSGLVLWPWAVVAFASGRPRMGVWLIIVYISVMVMRRFAEPKLVSSGIGTNPILTLMSMYIGYKIFSIGGLILGPVLLMFGISLYKAGMFDGILRGLKIFIIFTKEQCLLLKNFFIKLIRSDWNE